MIDPKISFQRWFVEPLEKLRELPNGDGGFIALAAGCFLYERYAAAVIQAAGGKADRDGKIQQLATDFQIDLPTAKVFWDVIRDGLLHQGMPKSREHGKAAFPKWAFHSAFPRPIQFGKINGEDGLLVEPWRFAQHVIQLWQANLPLIDRNGGFPWANIATMSIEFKASHESSV